MPNELTECNQSVQCACKLTEKEHPMRHTNSRAGFTLVELAIVLVIIGLIIGGVLVGQDLIKAATIRSTVSDLEKINASANTFRNKYNGLPGDLLAGTATGYNLSNRAGTSGRGDGNGLIEGCAANIGNVLGCETGLFWVDLSTAGLVTQSYTTATDGAAVSLGSSAAFATYLQRAKLRETAYITVTTASSRNFFYVGGLTATNASGVYTETPAVSTSEAKNIDTKVDDGLPGTGTTVAISGLNISGYGYTIDPGAASATGVCVNITPTPDDYNVVPAYIDEINCKFVTRTSF